MFPLAQAAAEGAPIAVGHPALWGGFIVFMLCAMVLDLGLMRKSKGLSTKAATTWVILWMSLALTFNAGLWWYYGRATAQEFFAGYLLELSLSVDNLFVFVLVFSFFKTPPHLQHRALVWGIIGAMVLRALMILVGAALIHEFHITLAFFGAFLIYSGIKLVVADDDNDPSKSKLIQFLQRRLPLLDDYRGEHFMVKEGGKRVFTRLFLVLLVIEASDVVFAVDSVPAIFGVTEQPFIVFTSNMFAILGLRSLYFVIASLIQKLRYLNYGLAIVLSFIGVKMILPFVPSAFGLLTQAGVGLPPSLKGLTSADMTLSVTTSLTVIVTVLAATTILSLIMAPREADRPKSTVRMASLTSEDDLSSYASSSSSPPPEPQAPAVEEAAVANPLEESSPDPTPAAEEKK